MCFRYHLVQLTPSQEWRYLGVDFRPIGVKRPGKVMNEELDRLTRAPLKPQQHLKILRCYLVVRFYYHLTLAGATLGGLRVLDKQVRAAIRKWLRLPADIPTAYFHTSCRLGGLGIPSFTTTIPRLVHSRLSSLASSTSPAARVASQSVIVTKRLLWAERVLTRQSESLVTSETRDKWWAECLYRSVDGKELRESGKSSMSTYWIVAGSVGIPGRDYVQYHVRINSLPTRIRTSRGFRRAERVTECRAGCTSTETAAHVIQACFRTHGGRILRHNPVCRVLASGLRDKGWEVMEEPHIPTRAGTRKPDLVAAKDDRVCVIDSQVVSG